MKKRMIAMFLLCALVLGLLAACGSVQESAAPASEAIASSAEDVTEPTPNTEAVQQPVEGSAEDSALETEPLEDNGAVVPGPVELPIVEDEVHYTCWTPVAPYVNQFMSLDEFSEKIQVVKLFNEATNVYIDYEVVAGGWNDQETFELMVATGDYTDIIGCCNYYSTGIDGAIEDEVIIDLYDDLKEYAPNFWSRLSSDTVGFMQQVTDAGHMGAIPILFKRAGTESGGMIIRKDWLEAAGMDKPETLDEMEQYVTYCKNNYGAYAYLNYNGYDGKWGACCNVSPGNFNVRDGVVEHSFVSDEFELYLTKMNDFYKKGLFHDDFYNDGEMTSIRNDMANDLCCYVEGSAESMSNIYEMNPDNSAMALTGINYPKADEVEEIHVGDEHSTVKPLGAVWAVSTACGDYIPFLQLVNFIFSEEGQLLYNWGEEGVAYTLDENGDPQWTDLVVNNPDGLSFMFASYIYATGVGSTFMPGVYDMEKGFYSYNDDQLEAVDIFANLSDCTESLPSYVALSLEEQTEYNSLSNELGTYADTEVFRFITGDRSLDTFDDFKDTCISIGLDRMTELEQAAYDRAMEKLSELK